MRRLLLLVACISFVQAVGLISPDDGLVTYADHVLFSWETGGQSYLFQVSNHSDFSSLVVNTSVSDPFYSATVPVSTLFWRVCTNASCSSVRRLDVLPVPEFDVAVDLSSHEESGFARLLITAPNGSAVHMAIHGGDSPITYNPQELVQKEWYVKLESGEYSLSANVSHHDFSDELSFDFTVPSSQASSTDDPGSNESDTNESDANESSSVDSYVRFDLFSEGEPLDDVRVRYEGPENGAGIADSFLLENGRYEFVFEKEGYADKSLSLEIEGNRSITVDLDQVTEEVSSDLQVSITSPAEGATISESSATITYDGAGDCQLLIRHASMSGWTIAQGDGNTVYEDQHVDQGFSVSNLLGGAYNVKVRCTHGSLHGVSDEVSFIVSLTEDLSSDELKKLKGLKKKIGGMRPLAQQALEDVISTLTSVTEKIESYTAEYNANAPELKPNERATRKDKIASDVDRLMSQVPESIQVDRPRHLIVYLPQEGSQALVEDFLRQENFSRDERTVLFDQSKQPYILDVRYQTLELSYAGGVEERQIITKTLNTTLDADEFILEQVPGDVRFLGSHEEVGEYHVLRNNNYSYVAGPLDVKDTKTVAFAGKTPANLVTGLAIGRFIPSMPVLAGVIAVVVCVVLLVPAFSYFSPYNRLLKDMHVAGDLVQKKGVPAAIDYYPRIFNLYDKLKPHEKDQLRPVMEELGYHLRMHSLEENLAAYDKKHAFLQRLGTFDADVYNELRYLYHSVIDDYEALPHSYKLSFTDRIMEIRERNLYKTDTYNEM
ncbi:MAG: hypothetical protein ACQESG_05825 [Nanobdellota archaeon]